MTLMIGSTLALVGYKPANSNEFTNRVNKVQKSILEKEQKSSLNTRLKYDEREIINVKKKPGEGWNNWINWKDWNNWGNQSNKTT